MSRMIPNVAGLAVKFGRTKRRVMFGKRSHHTMIHIEERIALSPVSASVDPRNGSGIRPQALGSLYPALKHPQRASGAKASQLERERACAAACVAVFRAKGGTVIK